ncbi:hypothetical protein J2Z62_000260 [Mycoplasmoides fastidiosum]|uniref:DNA polymerase III subunit delta n=1 Tax=Mycoplasmoides fastidiosum TaxID=92758 RepID=A0ABU0LYN8_9BACT|nr:hypothetical protein [Mycoplasmoides fastidiosum]MDQ0513822.1 hypothetical protein [Mycoplasmoides fastidiosum]UUD37761.1 hypothetical protein NPA10_04325 [Mycoplasmoides fastidiosum]
MIFAKWATEIKTLNQLPHSIIINLNSNSDADLIVQDFFQLTLNLNKKLTNQQREEFGKAFINNTYSDYFPVKDIEKNTYLKKDFESIFEGMRYSLNNKNHIRLITIFNAEKLNEKISNSLLKLIEEPGLNTYVILFTNNYQNILNTIKSRCIYFNLNLTNPFQDRTLSESMKALIYANYDRAEINYLDQINRNKKIFEFTQNFFANYQAKKLENFFDEIKNFFQKLDNTEMQLFLDYLIYLLRNENKSKEIFLIDQLLKFKANFHYSNPRIAYIYLLNLLIKNTYE